MKQVNNGYAEYYYMLEDGTIYNSADDTIINPDKRHFFNLHTDNKYKKRVAQRTLYKLVYNKIFCIDDIQNIDNEQWKEIKDTNRYYYISDKGRIKSLQGYRAIILKPFVNKGQYDRVDIVFNGKRRSMLVHRLVAQYFLPMPNSIDMQLHHKDFNKHNNAANNLEWLTPAAHSKIHCERMKEENECTKSKEDTDRKNK